MTNIDLWDTSLEREHRIISNRFSISNTDTGVWIADADIKEGTITILGNYEVEFLM